MKNIRCYNEWEEKFFYIRVSKTLLNEWIYDYITIDNDIFYMKYDAHTQNIIREIYRETNPLF